MCELCVGAVARLSRHRGPRVDVGACVRVCACVTDDHVRARVLGCLCVPLQLRVRAGVPGSVPRTGGRLPRCRACCRKPRATPVSACLLYHAQLHPLAVAESLHPSPSSSALACACRLTTHCSRACCSAHHAASWRIPLFPFMLLFCAATLTPTHPTPLPSAHHFRLKRMHVLHASRAPRACAWQA